MLHTGPLILEVLRQDRCNFEKNKQAKTKLTGTVRRPRGAGGISGGRSEDSRRTAPVSPYRHRCSTRRRFSDSPRRSGEAAVTSLYCSGLRGRNPMRRPTYPAFATWSAECAATQRRVDFRLEERERFSMSFSSSPHKTNKQTNQ